MKRFWRAACAAGLVIVAGEAGRARAQVPPGGQAPIGAPSPTPGAPATPTGVTPGVGPAPSPLPPGAARVGFFKRACAALDDCRRKLCATPAGQLLNGMTRPMTTMTGGVIPPFCPVMPSPQDLQQPGVTGAAAAAQKEALEAKARRAAVRFLGTLDCRYNPDAAVALAAALRTDPSECVRWEAALVLGYGCCCTEITVKALEASVSGTDADGNPAERSARVRCAAAAALERCLACYVPPPIEPPPPPVKTGETPPGEVAPGVTPEGKPADVLPAPTPVPPNTLPAIAPGGSSQRKDGPGHHRTPSRQTIERARQTLNEFNALLAAQPPLTAMRPPGSVPGRQSVYELLKDTADETPAGYPMPAPMVVQAPVPAPAVTPPPARNHLPVTAPQPVSAQTPAAAPQPISTQMPVAPQPVSTRPAAPMPPKPAAPDSPAEAPAPAQSPEPGRAPAAMPPLSAAPRTDARVTPAAATVREAPPAADPAADWGRKVLQAPTAAERHAAIRQIVRFDWQKHPVVPSVLLTGAKADPLDAVRVDCIRHLAAYKMNHPQVLADLAALIADPDPWVRQEAAQAVAQLKQ